ncbi:Acyltransferase [Aphelenchoides besseyi]|nr:Acyltransferase [Aphelenchoides besseyi]
MTGGVKTSSVNAASRWFKPSADYDDPQAYTRFVNVPATRGSTTNANNNKATPDSSKTAITPTESEIKRGRFHRFLESVAVGIYVFGFAFAPIFAFPYMIWCVYDWKTPKRGSRAWKTFRELSLWRYMASYFPMKIIKTASLPPDRNYIVGAHPHGILSFSTFLTFCTEACGFNVLFPGLERRFAVTLSVQYWFPIRRELLLFTISAIEHVLQMSDKGTVVALVPGGAAEALDSSPDCYRLTLKNRKGFIKVALQNGAALVPSYSFGETSAFKQIPNPEGSRLREFQNVFKRFTGVTTPFFYGCGFLSNRFGFLPFRTPINLVVGRPIEVQKKAEPTFAEINDLHDKYCRELNLLFEEHKQKYGVPPEAKLEFV